MQENLKRYKSEQPVIDSKGQLLGKVIDEGVVGALQQSEYMTREHMVLIDTILTLLGPTIEAEYHCWITAINAIVSFCNMEEGPPSQ